MNLAKLQRLKTKAYQRLALLRSRASDDERLLGDGGRANPRYRSVERAYRRYQRLNSLYSAARKNK